MDFSVIFQLRTKKFWWMDVIFYFVISLFVATVLCYLIFLTKNSFQRQDIQKEDAALQTVGTDQQKGYEKNVIDYRNRITDFAELFKNHKFASNVFAFIQDQTLSNIWFGQFTFDEKNNQANLTGESDDMDAFARQVAILESENNKKYVKSIGTLNSTLGTSARVGFNISLTLDDNIFNYISSKALISQTTSPSEQQLVQQGANEQQNPETQQGAQSIEKLITSFHLLLNPEVIGSVDETNYNIALNVPYGTDVKTLIPSIVISTGAAVSPASGVVQDFTNPVTYVVTAQDGSTQNYQVKVTVAAKPVVKKSSPLGLIALIFVILIVIVALAAVIIILIRRRNLSRRNKF